jgi:LAGLIDADG endonuclease
MLTEDAWLTGFVEGEGCFGINSANAPYFNLSQRADNIEIIEALQMAFGGSIHVTPMRSPAAPRAMWYVTAKRHLEALVLYFDQFPLRTRKAQDYAIWRRAVVAYIARGKHHPDLPALRQALMATRAYEAAEALDADSGIVIVEK